MTLNPLFSVVCLTWYRSHEATLNPWIAYPVPPEKFLHILSCVARTIKQTKEGEGIGFSFCTYQHQQLQTVGTLRDWC